MRKDDDMTWKKFWKRVNALLHDNRTVLREGENIEDWEEVQRKQREEEAERQKKTRNSRHMVSARGIYQRRAFQTVPSATRICFP